MYMPVVMTTPQLKKSPTMCKHMPRRLRSFAPPLLREAERRLRDHLENAEGVTLGEAATDVRDALAAFEAAAHAGDADIQNNGRMVLALLLGF